MTDQIQKPGASCQDDFDPASLAPDAALQKILAAILPISETEIVPLRSGLDRALARDVASTIDVPNCINSAMDGYAVIGSDLPQSGVRELRVIGTVFAGEPLERPVTTGTCARIMTGGVLPAGTDTVVIQEQVERIGDTIRLDGNTRPGDNVRQAGEDIRRGEVILTRGMRLKPADLGLIASLGIGEVTVVRKPRIAFFSTGDELRSIGDKLNDGDVYDSNRYTLYGMLARLGAEIFDLGVIRDVREDVERAFQEASAAADMVITSGGVSVGEADYIKETLEKIGRINFWKIAIKPGRPLAFGRIGDSLFFGLPGNPVSVMVTFYQFVQPAINKLMGREIIEPVTIRAVCRSRLKKRPGRVEFQRGILSRAADGQLVVEKTGAQGSGILSSMSQANCFIILHMESEGVPEGSVVDVQPFFGII